MTKDVSTMVRCSRCSVRHSVTYDSFLQLYLYEEQMLDSVDRDIFRAIYGDFSIIKTIGNSDLEVLCESCIGHLEEAYIDGISEAEDLLKLVGYLWVKGEDMYRARLSGVSR